MSHATLGRVRPLAHTVSRNSQPGLAQGTVILTLDGALPVEYLSVGDRIITRGGARVLRGLTPCAADGLKLEFDRPEVIYADGQQLNSETCLPH